MKKAEQPQVAGPVTRLAGLLAALAFFIVFGWVDRAPGATLNDITVTDTMIRQEIAFLRADAARRNLIRADTQPPLPSRKELAAILSDRLLLLKEALRRRIKVKPALVRKAWNDFRRLQKEDPAGLFAGLDRRIARRRIEEGLRIERLLKKVVLRDVRVREKEIAAFYKSRPDGFQTGQMVRARHIMVKSSARANEEIKPAAYEKLSRIQQRLLEGANFAALAIRYSDCPSKSRGGDLGYFTRDEVIPEFAAAAFSLAPGQLSTIVESRYGYHLIQVIDVRPAGFLSFKKARPLIKRYLYRQKARKAVQSFLEQIRKQAENKQPAS